MSTSIRSVEDHVVRADAVVVDLDRGPAESYAGIRHALLTLRAEGATFGDLPSRYSSEWAELFPGEVTGAARLSDIALAASERRLHRESEQVYRVLSVAAAALCAASAELDKTIALRGAGGADLSSLRGLMLAVERSAITPGARLELVDPTRVRVPAGPHADYRAERVRCLNRMGLPVTVGDLSFDLADLPDSGFAPFSEEGRLYAQAVDADSARTDRIAAALAYCRRAFFSANWEGMAIVAKDALGLLRGLPETAVAEVLTKAERQDGFADAIEFETVILRTTADLRAFLLKVLGIQAGFRGDQDTAIGYFRSMRTAVDGLSPELLAQSHLYTALTLSKRKGQLPDAIAEVEEGFTAVPATDGEPDSVRRERGWLHNLRALTLFAQKKFTDAFQHEKQALACLEGLGDASSAHLRINLYSNISVLQEKAGKLTQAHATWDKFRQASGAGNAAFLKHHAYRSGGIRLLIDERTEALADLATTLENAVTLNDDFHECEVRLEVGGLLARSGESEAAAEQFRLAEIAARRIGDPYHVALAQAGLTVITGEANDAAGTARRSTSYPAKAAALADAIGNNAAVLELLPSPKTKLNRPFDPINFQD
ncbi:hypothetical protein ACIA8G_12500 [Lentzea sp. NPDC051213]|uniref:hypothetical protein n=1 Tax=Lentzea sp. NPDC051213 TaxID=3364126 RepID=UPI0037968DDF